MKSVLAVTTGKYQLDDLLPTLDNADAAEIRSWIGAVWRFEEVRSFDWDGKTLRLYGDDGQAVTAYPALVPDCLAHIQWPPDPAA